VVGLAYPLGAFIAELFEGRRTFLSPGLASMERGLYRFAGVDAAIEQGWLAYALNMLVFVGACFVSLCAPRWRSALSSRTF
jgi:K+-transporting ATPase ATPase A chain